MLSGAGSRRARAERGIARVVALLALLLAADVAAAEPVALPTPVGDAERPEDRRTALYHEGVEAATAGLWAQARDRFRETLAIRTSPKVLFSLAQAEEQLGQVASAYANYGRALEGAKAAGESEVAVAADEAQRALEPLVPHVRIFVSGTSVAKVSATLDDVPVALGTAVAADPGAHRLLVSAPGMRGVTASIAIGERQQLDVPVQLEPAPLELVRPLGVPPTSPAAASGATGPFESGRAGRASPWRTVGIVTAGAGIVAFGVGAALGLVANSENNESNSDGCHGNNCTPDAAEVRQHALNTANAATVALAVGGVLAASGVVIWLVAPSGEIKRALAIAPLALAGGGGVLLSGRWR
jgi:hypothetical protein